MKKIIINVVVDMYDDSCDVDIEIEIGDEAYEKLVPLCERMEEEVLKDEECREFLENDAPDVLKEIEDAVDKAMPNNIDLDEGETIDDVIWSWSAQLNSIMLC